MSSIFTLFFAGQFFLADPNQSVQPIDMQIFPPQKNITEEVKISAQSALVMDVESGMVIYQKNIHEKRSIASLTKLMTALIVLQETNLWETAEVKADAPLIEGGKMFLLSGEKMKVSDLLTGLLVRSANDSAVALAEYAGGTLSEFVQMMNLRAHYLGLKDTHFANPHGLDDPQNYSTAFDIALLAKKLLQSDFVRNTVQIQETVVSDVSGEFHHTLKTTNELLHSPFPIYGLKTGTTDAAGQCFVGLVKRSGREYLIVVLGSEDRFYDTKTLIWAIEQE